MARIKVLIVDDSMVFREVLSRGIATDTAIEIVATAEDPFDARDKILKYSPDVMVCDVEMPKMNGIEFIKRLLPQYPLPVIVVSAINDAIFEALRHGAVDFVTKPDFKSVEGIEGFIHRLINKIKASNSFNCKAISLFLTIMEASIALFFISLKFLLSRYLSLPP